MLACRHVLAGAAAVLAAGRGRAAGFPEHSLRLVVSSAPGASLDTLARILAPTVVRPDRPDHGGREPGRRQ